ncbi:MAG: hypothetical protein ABR607_02305 [Pyrinomonadaceae bacterium]
MEIIGDDKRIRALCSELRLADEQAAPSFTSLMNRAQSRTGRPGRAFNLSFAALTALLVCAVVSLAVWSQYPQSPATYSAFADVPALNSLAPQVRTEPTYPPTLIKIVHWPVRPRATKSRAQSDAPAVASNRTAARKPKNIDSWQSPTAALLTSSTDGLFKSLPQLNENANELKSFLPSRANEKEK